MRLTQLMLIVMSGLALAGCPKKQTTLPDASNPAEQSTTDTGATTDTDVTGRADPNETLKQAAKQAGTIIYFEYDRAEIKPEFVPIVTAHAKYLNANAAATKCGSKAIRTSAARASTTSVSVSGAHRRCGAR